MKITLSALGGLLDPQIPVKILDGTKLIHDKKYEGLSDTIPVLCKY